MAPAVVYAHNSHTGAPGHKWKREEVQMGYQEMREVQQDARRCEVIRGDTKRCVEIRGWHQGKSFRFIFVFGRHPQDFRAGGGA